MPAKPLTWTQHARDAIEERELAPEWIEQAVREPDWSEPDLRRPGVDQRFRVIPAFGNRILRVACFETATEIRIVTAFFDRDARQPQ